MKSNIFKILFILFVVLVAQSCEKEPIEPSREEATSLEKVETGEIWPLESLEIESIIKTKSSSSGNSAKARSSQDQDAFQVSGQIKDPTTSEKLTLNFHLWPSTKYRDKLIKRLKKNEWDKIKEEYSGAIIAYNLNSTEQQFRAVYEKGEYKSKLYSESELALLYVSDCELHTLTITTHHYTDWWVNGNYVGSTYNGSSTEVYEWIECYGGSDPPPSGGGTSVTNDENTGNTILPYSCESFILHSTGSNKYSASLSNIKLSFYDVLKLRSYNFYLSIDIEFSTNLKECEIKNNLAASLNSGVQDVVRVFGLDRVYRLSNASDIIESDLEIAVEKEIKTRFGGGYVQVPSDNYLGNPSPIPALPGQSQNCCN